jgi:chemotaxis protein methyltransferase CheR
MMGAAALAQRPSSAFNEVLSRRNFSRLASYIYDYSGIKMPENKKTMLEGRLRRRLRATGIDTLDAYCESLFDGGLMADESLHLINAVTTNKTDFFREPAHFDYLRATILPDLEKRGIRSIRCWSAACSTGPEPYTVAMMLDDFVGTNGMTYGILATDLDTDVLETARRGIYPADLVEPVPAPLQRKYVMMPRDAARNDVRMSPDLRSAIGFARLNLMNVHYPVGDAMHLIFCRNVLIYFDKPTQKKVVSQLINCLEPGGHLFLGHSESIAGFDLPLKQVANTVFQRT